MGIKDIFVKDINRQINGVVKAEEHDKRTVWNELDEYVVTKELKGYFDKFFSGYIESLKSPNTDTNGVWISGFFGSGKSHFLKILSYILKNDTCPDPTGGEDRSAVDFFEGKIEDSILFANLKECSKHDIDVILFNIDSKAKSSGGRQEFIKVFLREFYGMLGYCSEYIGVGQLEKHVDGKGKYEEFKETYQSISDGSWVDERSDCHFHRDTIVETISAVLGMSKDAAQKLVDEKIDNDIEISPEGLAKEIAQYLESKGKDHRIIFLVDEVGQFVGDNRNVMLALQTITEQLGVQCKGKAWIVVTSQEDIEAVLGSEWQTSKEYDFSKIQGRFQIRMSLSSTNTDEVIQKRLLEKTDDAEKELNKIYEDKGDILKNQLSFTDGASLKQYKEASDFTDNYPFAPYHFDLIQKIFESIRKAGATGQHLSRGERSLLDAFQRAAFAIEDKDIGALAPLHSFYTPIADFLDTAVKRMIAQSEETGVLTEDDTNLLKSLFLIRYVDDKYLKPNLDNLVTLCIDEVDADKIVIKGKVEESLLKLEKEILITRNGDLYYFLTDEEKDVQKEIQRTEISPQDVNVELSKLIFEEVFGDESKHSWPQYKKHFKINKKCDGAIFKNITDGDLNIEVITPLNEDYETYNNMKCMDQSGNDGGTILLKLEENKDINREITAFLKTEKYVKQQNMGSSSESLDRIIRDQQHQNRARKKILSTLLAELVLTADIYISGQHITDISASDAKTLLQQVCQNLCGRVFTKITYIRKLQSDPTNEIKHIILSDDVAHTQIDLEGTDHNPEAISEVRTYIERICSEYSKITLKELVDRFEKSPYGWPWEEICLVVARLFSASEISLVKEATPVDSVDAVDALTKTGQFNKVIISKTKKVDSKVLEGARKLAKDLFHNAFPDAEDDLAEAIRIALVERNDKIKTYNAYATQPGYVGEDELESMQTILNSVVRIPSPYEFLNAFVECKDKLQEEEGSFNQVLQFYDNQIGKWNDMRRALDMFGHNKDELSKDEDAAEALEELISISKDPSPYSKIKDIDGLVSKIEKINATLVKDAQGRATYEVESKIDEVQAEIKNLSTSSEASNKALTPLQSLKTEINGEQSIPDIHYLQTKKLVDIVEEVFSILEQDAAKDGKKAPKEQKKVRSINPVALYSKTYLETEGDVKDYTNTLEGAMMDAINNNERVRLK